MKNFISILISICFLFGITPTTYSYSSDNQETSIVPEPTIIASGSFDVLDTDDNENEENEQESAAVQNDNEEDVDSDLSTEASSEAISGSSAMSANAVVVLDSGTCGTNAAWELHEDGCLYISGSGAMADYSYTTMPWVNYKGTITNVIIGSGVTKIGAYSFYGFIKIKTVNISNSVTNIANYAFSGCSLLKELSLGTNVSSIGSNAFSSCALPSVYIPASVATISSNAFNMSSCLTVTIANSSASIGSNAFCKQQDATIYGNKGSTAETYAKNNYFDFVPLAVDNGHTGLKWTIYSSGTGSPYNEPTTILEVTGEGSFPNIIREDQSPWHEYAESITEVVIGEGVQSGNGFYYYSRMSRLSKVTVLDPNVSFSLFNPSRVTYYGFAGSPVETYANNNNAAFVPITSESGTSSNVNWKYYSGIGLLYLDGYGSTATFSSLANVPWYSYRTSIKRIKIGENVSYVSNNAFYGMTNLKELIINNRATAFGVDVLKGGNTSARIFGYENAEKFAEIYDKKYDILLRTNGNMFVNYNPSSDTTKNWTLYTNGLLEINGKGSFSSFTASSPAPWSAYSDRIRSVSIGETITGIGSNFMNLSNVSVTVYSPNLSFNGTPFGSSFNGNLYGYENSTTDNYCYDNNYNFVPFEDAGAMNSLYWRLEDGGLLRIGGTGDINNYSSPNLLPWYNYRSQIKNVVIEEKVTRIGNNSFNGCSNLVSVMIANSSLTLGSNVFANTNSTFTIIAYNDSAAHTYATNNGYNYDSYIIDSGRCGNTAKWTFHEDGKITIYGTGSMYDYTEYKRGPWNKYQYRISSIDIRQGITSVGDYAFYFSNASSLSLPNSLTNINAHSFGGCSYLSGVTIPNNVTTIGDYAFAETFIKNLSLGNKIQAIGNYAFYENELTSVTIPASVYVIGSNSFNSTTLKNITIPGDVRIIGSNAFKNNSGTVIHGKVNSVAQTYANNNGITFVAIGYK